MPAVSYGQGGLYMCFFVPPLDTEAHPCELNVVQARPQNPDAEEDGDLLPVVVPYVIGAVVALIGIVVLAICLYRRRCSRRPGQDLLELKEPMIPSQRPQIKTLLEGFSLSDQQLVKVMAAVEQEMTKGLDPSTRQHADLKMYPTFLTPRLDQSGTGECLVLSLDHSHLRISLLTLHNHPPSILSASYSIAHKTRLFDFVVDRSKQFLLDKKVSGHKLPVVLILAFPCQHESLGEAVLTRWTKEFNATGVEGRELQALFHVARNAKRKESKKLLGDSLLDKLDLVVIVNDAVSTLLSVAHNHPSCRVALVLGSGVNASYVQDWTTVDSDRPEDDQQAQDIINTELGALGESGCLDFCRTECDRQLDDHSRRPGTQILEKMLGKDYMGELVRLSLEQLTKEGLLFRAASLSCALFQRETFSFEFVMAIEGDTEAPYDKTAHTLKGLGLLKHTHEDLKAVRLVCQAVCQRAAFLTAACLAALINRVGQPMVTVVIDGHIFRRHPRFCDMVNAKTLRLVKPGLRFGLASSNHSSSLVGAARVAVSSLSEHKPYSSPV